MDVRAYGVNRGELFVLQQRADDWRPGQDVAGLGLRAAADGSGWSERVAVPSHWAAVRSAGVSFEQATSLPIAGLAARRALRVGGRGCSGARCR